MKPMPLRCLALAITLASLLGGCAVGPDYRRPTSAPAVAFKEAAGWKAAQPADSLLRGDWWTLYGDPQLNALVARLNANNQSLASAEAQFRQARALAAGSRAGFFPTLGMETGVTRSGRGGQSTLSSSEGVVVNELGDETEESDETDRRSSSGTQITNSYDASLSISWELDIWGRLRRQLEADNASLQASAADWAAVRLSQQSELVQDYLQLRVIDQQKRLLDETVQAYQRSLRIADNQYRAGIAPRSDVTQAITQLRTAQADAVDLEYQRAQLEHAIAVLIGEAPAQFSLAVRDALPALPAVPLALPSALLERRPDVAAAERRVMAANATIGVAKAAYFPDLMLSANGGYRSSQVSGWISKPNRFWSIGPSFTLPLFDGGLIRSQVEQARASYDQTVADYRQTVLGSFREVEDYLVQLAVLEREAVVQQQALEAARESLRLMLNQYRAGTVDFTQVVSVQTSALSSERTRLTLQGSRLTASVLLIAALGGGWNGAGPPQAARPE